MRKDRVVGEMLGAEKALSPSDLYNTDFKSAVMGGYDKKEVDTFLEHVGDVFESLITQVREQKEELDKQREQILSSREMESTLRNALANMHKLEHNTLDAARREGDAIREQARIELLRARQQSRDLPEKLRQEIAQLKREREQLRLDLGAILRTHYALMKNIPRAEDLDAEESGELFEQEAAPAEEEPWEENED